MGSKNDCDFSSFGRKCSREEAAVRYDKSVNVHLFSILFVSGAVPGGAGASVVLKSSVLGGLAAHQRTWTGPDDMGAGASGAMEGK